MRFFLTLFIIIFFLYGFNYKDINPDKDKLLIEIISYVLERGHYDPKDVNDDFSEKVFINSNFLTSALLIGNSTTSNGLYVYFS